MGKTTGLLIVVGILTGVVLYLQHPTLNPTPEVKLASVVSSLSPEAPALPAEVQDLQATIAAGRHGESYDVTLSQEQLSSLANSFLETRPAIPFTDVRIVIDGEKVIADATTKGLAITLPLRVTGIISAKNGSPLLQIEEVSLGRASLPGFMRDRILSEVNASLDFSRYSIPLTVETIELRDGMLSVRGTVK